MQSQNRESVIMNCNADEGTVNLFEWLRFKGKTITAKQRKLEVNAIAWLEKHLDEPVPE